MVAALVALTLAASPAYDAAYAKACSDIRPLIVFVGVPALEVKGAIVVSVSRVDWHKGAGVIVSVPRYDARGKVWLEWTHTLDAMATTGAFVETILQREIDRIKATPDVAPPLHPFAQPSFRMFRGGGGRSC